jgi:hypothetical protein
MIKNNNKHLNLTLKKWNLKLIYPHLLNYNNNNNKNNPSHSEETNQAQTKFISKIKIHLLAISVIINSLTLYLLIWKIQFWIKSKSKKKKDNNKMTLVTAKKTLIEKNILIYI